LAGHIAADATFLGLGQLDRAAAERAMARSGTDADGVIAVVNANMEQALRAVSVERGSTLEAWHWWPSAAPVHCMRVRWLRLDMSCVIVPARAGVFSAVGILAAARRVDRGVRGPPPVIIARSIGPSRRSGRKRPSPRRTG
jgi:N-methylhydantoinase A/oxoprolinase/acetone carboxylase beta subunit